MNSEKLKTLFQNRVQLGFGKKIAIGIKVKFYKKIIEETSLKKLLLIFKNK